MDGQTAVARIEAAGISLAMNKQYCLVAYFDAGMMPETVTKMSVVRAIITEDYIGQAVRIAEALNA